MLKTVLNCHSSCQLRHVCHAAEGCPPRMRSLGQAFRRYCRHTRWLLIAALATPVAALAAVGVKLWAA